MKKFVKRMAKFMHGSLSIVIAMSMMLSVCAISGISVMAAQTREVYVYSSSRTPYVHAWASEGDLTGGWSGCAASSAGVSGWYKKTFTTSNSYGLIVHNNSGNQWNIYSSTTGTSNLKVLNYNGSTGGSDFSSTTYSLKGSFDNWASDFSMTTFDTSKIAYKYTKSVSAGTYKFRVHTGDTWYANNFDNSRGNLDLSINGDNLQFTTSSAGNVTIYYDPGNGKMFADFSTSSGGSGESGGGNEGGGGNDGPVTTDSYDAIVSDYNFGNGIVAVDATYFDYISDKERERGYLNPVQAGTENFNGAEDNWYPFYIFNRAIRNKANSNSYWSKPLYLGNFCNTYDAYATYKHSGDYNNAVNTEGLARFDYSVNNSNGLSNMFQSYQGLVKNTLKDGNLMVTDTLKLPYFDTEFLSQKYDDNGNVSSSGKKIAKIYKSYFPFNEKTDASTGITTYTFDSTDAKDNVYFTWNGTTPTAVNYGEGTDFGVQDGISRFMNGGTSGYGIFPFNNAKGSNGGNNNLDYGFGIRLDISFRVPKNGTVDGTTTGDPITFDYSGDDDLWVYIADEAGNSELVLDLGGSHKKTSGSINFKTMKATVNDSYAGRDSSYSSTSVSVPSDEFWVTSQYTNFKIYAWNGGSNTTIQPVTTKNGYYVFEKEQFAGYTDCIFFHSDGGIGDNNKLTGNMSISSSWYGKILNENASTNSATTTTVDTKTIMGGTQLDPTKTYKMTVFYMERGLIESNFKVGFTFAPLTNSLTTQKEVNTANVNSGLTSAVETLDQFTIKNQYSSSQNGTYSNLGNKTYTYTDSNGMSTKTSASDGTYSIVNDASAMFTKITETNNWLKVTEQTPNSNLTYDTTYTVTDVENNKVVAEGEGREAKFLFSNTKNSSGGDEYLTNYNVKYVNTPSVTDFNVSKTAYDSDGVTELTDQAFTFTIKLDLKGGTNYSPYNLKYKIGNTEYNATNGVFTLKGGQTATFVGIPVGATYQIVESATSDYTVTSHSSGVASGVISSTSNTVSYVNKKLDKSDATVTISAGKTLGGNVPNVNTFSFALTEYQLSGGKLVKKTNGVTKTANNDGGTVTFETLSYEYQAGTSVEKFYYVIEENALDTDAYIYDDTKYYAVVSLDRTTTPNTATVKYYSTESGAINSNARYEVSASNLAFANEYRFGTVNVTKTDGNGNVIGDSVKFKLYKTTGDGGVLSDTNLVSPEQTVNSEGKVAFTNLPIYTGQLDGSDLTTSQWYCLVETETKEGYSLTGAKRYFTIPLSKVLDNQNSTTYDFISGGVKYNYVLKNGSKVYEFTCDVDNFPVFSPDTSGTGMKIFFYLGFGIIATATLLAVSYTVYDKAERKKRKERHARVN